MQSGWEKRPTQSKETLLVLSFLPLQFCNWSVHSRGWSNVPDCEQDPRKNPDQKMFPGSKEKFYFEHERCKKANFSLYRRTGEKIKVNLYDCLNFLSLIIVGANHILWRAGRGKPRTPRWDQTLTWEGREESCSHPSHTKEGPEKIKSQIKKHFIQWNIHWKVSEQVSMDRLAHEEDCAGAVVAPVMTQARYNLCK